MSITPFSRYSNARVSDAVQYCGLQTIILENELVRIVILPEKGGEIFEFRYKKFDVDPLFCEAEYPAACCVGSMNKAKPDPKEKFS